MLRASSSKTMADDEQQDDEDRVHLKTNNHRECEEVSKQSDHTSHTITTNAALQSARGVKRAGKKTRSARAALRSQTRTRVAKSPTVAPKEGLDPRPRDT